MHNGPPRLLAELRPLASLFVATQIDEHDIVHRNRLVGVVIKLRGADRDMARLMAETASSTVTSNHSPAKRLSASNLWTIPSTNDASSLTALA